MLDGAAVLDGDGVVDPRRLIRGRRVFIGAAVVVVVVVVVVVSATVVVVGASVSGVSISDVLGEFSKEDIWTASTVVGSGLLVSSVGTVVERILGRGVSVGSSVGRSVERDRTIDVY